MTASPKTISEIVQERFETLTRAERQLANSLLENYPVSGLASITAVAKKADVSTPTVARMVQKLGFKGFPTFQAALRSELEAKISNPIVKHDLWAENAPDTHILNRFAESVVQNLHQTLAQLDPETFDKTCELLADPERSIFIAGGRITRTLADYLFSLMRMVRPKVTLVRSGASAWPDFLLDVKAGDVLVMFDIRRYENHILRLAEIAEEKDIRIVIFTDQWGSPITKYATHCFNCRIEAPSAWDSIAVMLMLVETMVAQIQSATWETTYERMTDLEGMFDRTGLFRKFK
ncbi:MAG TPA: MurR/RpiR family transcriptional regulator [Hyphomicrobiales bacterium]|nr:MurR/RpiR family transcriptional regulator [Hyphomicrobiales bacterium]